MSLPTWYTRLRPRLPYIAVFLAVCPLPAAPQAGTEPKAEPKNDSGQSVTAAFEGWYKKPDGTFDILVGYYNRNLKQELDIPIGQNNRIEAVGSGSPGGPDRGQPTHFVTGRQWGMFTIAVPKDFGDKKLTWTLTVNGATTAVPLSLNPLYEISPFIDATGNTPPHVGFSAFGPFAQGPRSVTATLTAAVSQPLSITVWAADDANKVPGASPLLSRMAPVSIKWTKFRGPGNVTFSNGRSAATAADFLPPSGSRFTGTQTTTATFSAPGDYILRVAGNDWSGEGGGGFQCCWTSAYVKVSVSK